MIYARFVWMKRWMDTWIVGKAVRIHCSFEKMDGEDNQFFQLEK